MRTFLHVGCGGKRKNRTTSGFNRPDWSELRMDIDESVQPDIVGTMLDMSAVPDASVDALYSSHNIEHLYHHELSQALAEFKRVLKPKGFVLNGTLRAAGFSPSIAAKRRGHPHFDLWTLATKSPIEEAELRRLAIDHFPA